MLFDDIELLIVLSEAKSLSQAADQLYMSRPDLSQRIAQMEKRFGTPLYRRTSIGIEITKAGEYVTAFARNTAKLERVLASQLAAIEERFDSTLEVGMSMNDGVALLPRLVAQYVEEDPSAGPPRCGLRTPARSPAAKRRLGSCPFGEPTRCARDRE